MAKYTITLFYCFFFMHMTTANAGHPVPSIELLEYLADLENNDNEWIDPLEMKELANNQIDEHTQEKGNE